MLLVSPDDARRAMIAVAGAREWPAYMIFVAVRSADCIAIGPREGLLHGDLLTWIRAHVVAQTGGPFKFRDEDVVDGYIECDDDGSMTIRTMDGKAAAGGLQSEIERHLHEGL